MIGTFDPKIELRGRYYFSFSTKALSLQLDDVLCSTCRGVGAVPGSVIYNLPATEIFVNFWDQSVIQGSVGSGLFVRSVVFEKTETFALQTSADYSTINIEVNYTAALDAKFGIISLKPSAHSGRSFVDIQKFANEAATFTIPFREFPSRTAGSSKAYDVALMVADELSRLKISGEDIGSVCGDVLLSTNG
jgi:hypothetical protein